MNFITQQDETTSTIHLEGELSLFNAPLLRKEIERVKDDCNHLIIDFSKVSYVDSTGIGVLVGTKKMLAEESKSFSLVAVSESFYGLLKTCSLIKFFHVYKDRAEALSGAAR